MILIGGKFWDFLEFSHFVLDFLRAQCSKGVFGLPGPPFWVLNLGEAQPGAVVEERLESHCTRLSLGESQSVGRGSNAYFLLTMQRPA